MGDYSDSIIVDVPPERLFTYLSDVKHLPSYLPRLKSARPEGGDKVEVTARIDPPDAPEHDVTGEAWIHVHQDDRILEWGAPGPHDYRGELHVQDGQSPDTCRLTVELHTEHAEGEHVDVGLEEALSGIKRAVETRES
ncbi:SRPBCC family protein [Streptomyces sp. NPDC046985]|uniref:SRPBCC family protein n=1 Tax=Streptomyces sp. NPDC046985 TaxID=3155377 RepID=UPI0033E341E0